MKNLNFACTAAFILLMLTVVPGCNNDKPKAVSKDITKTAVNVDGKKDSIINNPEKNYGNATISEPCIKCLIGIIQKTADYAQLTSSEPSQNIIYNANWITSSKPVHVVGYDKIINGMMMEIKIKGGDSLKKIAIYLYNNNNGQFYLQNEQTKRTNELQIDSLSLKNVRASCFWGVASAK